MINELKNILKNAGFKLNESTSEQNIQMQTLQSVISDLNNTLDEIPASDKAFEGISMAIHIVKKRMAVTK